VESFRQFLREHVISMQVGDDYLIQDDVTSAGLHRRHIVRDGDLPDPAWLDPIKAITNRVWAWNYKDNQGIGHLVIGWKEE
jgi:hypothetical protein